MKKTFRLIPALTAIFVLASCDINFGPTGSNSSDDSGTSATPSDGSSSSSGGSSSSSTPSSSSGSSSSASSSSSGGSSSSSSSSSGSSSSSSSSSSSGGSDTLTKTKIKQTYDDYHENNVWETDNAPSIGNANLLVIPVWFSDSSKYITSTSAKEQVRNDIDKAFFGTSEETGWHSVATFYEGESMGNLKVNGTTSDWYTYSSSSSSITTTERTNKVFNSAVTWYFNNNPSDSRKNYDGNGDGYLDSVVIIYAAPDYGASGSRNDNLWAYCYWMQEASNKNVSSPGINTYFWSSYDFMYDSDTAKTRAGTSYGSGDNSNANIDTHTFIHEMGHAFGLDDLYDYSDYGYAAAGKLSMQDYNVGGHDPFSMLALGWADPYIPVKPGEYKLKPFQTNHDLLLLTPLWNNYDSPFDEYILVELYTPTGMNKMDAMYKYDSRDKLPSATAIRIWHIDARLVAVNKISGGSRVYDAANITTNAHDGYYGVYQAMTNTYGDEDGYISCLGSSYANYNLVQYIRNSTSSTYTPSDAISNYNMFYDGDSFSMSTFSKQFVNGTKLNNGSELGWGFNIKIEGTGENAEATITLYNE